MTKRRLHILFRMLVYLNGEPQPPPWFHAMNVSVLTVPYDSGHYLQRMGAGPFAWGRVSGRPPALRPPHGAGSDLRTGGVSHGNQHQLCAVPTIDRARPSRARSGAVSARAGRELRGSCRRRGRPAATRTGRRLAGFARRLQHPRHQREWFFRWNGPRYPDGAVLAPISEYYSGFCARAPHAGRAHQGTQFWGGRTGPASAKRHPTSLPTPTDCPGPGLAPSATGFFRPRVALLRARGPGRTGCYSGRVGLIPTPAGLKPRHNRFPKPPSRPSPELLTKANLSR